MKTLTRILSILSLAGLWVAPLQGEITDITAGVMQHYSQTDFSTLTKTGNAFELNIDANGDTLTGTTPIYLGGDDEGNFQLPNVNVDNLYFTLPIPESEMGSLPDSVLLSVDFFDGGVAQSINETLNLGDYSFVNEAPSLISVSGGNYRWHNGSLQIEQGSVYTLSFSQYGIAPDHYFASYGYFDTSGVWHREDYSALSNVPLDASAMALELFELELVAANGDAGSTPVVYKGIETSIIIEVMTEVPEPSTYALLLGAAALALAALRRTRKQ